MIRLAALLALAACAAPPPAVPGPAEAACRRAAGAAGLAVTGASVAPLPAAGLGGAERSIGARVTLATPAGARLCLWTAGTGTAVIAAG